MSQCYEGTRARRKGKGSIGTLGVWDATGTVIGGRKKQTWEEGNRLSICDADDARYHRAFGNQERTLCCFYSCTSASCVQAAGSYHYPVCMCVCFCILNNRLTSHPESLFNDTLLQKCSRRIYTKFA